ncbi:MAG TPA: GMC family oxidoreductase, partial [Gaiellaceae bacterium]|nr:GMC family oxidoreductase [Gaiellaceae bacterium]
VDVGWEVSGAAFAMKPRSRGRVSLVSADPRAPLHVEHGFLDDPVDAATVATAVDELRAFGETDTVRPLVDGELRPGPGVDSASYVRENARGFFHPVGTCAIGPVVDSSCHVLGCEGLVVADASVMPTIPIANTNLTVGAIAERVAELLAD